MGNLNVLKSTIEIGLEKPIKLLHITDSHIFRDDVSGWNRKKAFDKLYDGCTEDFYHQAIKYAKDNGMTILHTGDVIDFFSAGNFEFLEKYFPKDLDYIYAAGNHDFVDLCDLNHGQEENREYKEKQINTIAPYIKNNLYFDSRIIGGVNIVTLDNSYYRISEGQLDMLKAEVAKGYPIVLGMHIPIYAPALAEASFVDWCPGVCFLMSAPEEMVVHYPADRKKQQAPDKATREAYEYIKNEPMIKTIIAGHLHRNHEEMLSSGKMQLCTHGSYAGYVREITII